ncbi:MAG: Holliday junction branch migration protein RuvA [Gemmatimonadales bacterium]|nr:Holliday junction branch migration protein RuvA [Gemmatimonadales bacterium]NIN10746.1 Holliday junction branch migration protein RuvA [Gemmatimonadales bacterium]NIQ98976.1 Holliday junction branch migration protein RuvA [Gemmatimonadales bacterium]NIS63795.1 Holliday junction branch migration protein RuvA [Gemmatimonadales bacterium]
MIFGVRGTIISKTGDRVIVATAGGVSYEIAVPFGVLENLPPEGTDVALTTVLVVREDGWALYGFDQEHERDVFQRLLGATGVGPRLALALVSTLGGARVVRSIKERDLAALCTVPGIGKKTAERMVLELKDRLGDIVVPGVKAAASAPAEQAVQALVNLGYSPTEADRAVRTVLSRDEPTEPVDLIRGALQLLTQPE